MSRLPRMLAVVVAGALCGAAETPPQSAAPSPREFMLSFNERGTLEPSSAAALADLAAAAPSATDVFILAHGWRNDAVTADCRYQLQVSGIARALPSASRPLFAKIMWPSAVFSVPHDECDSAPPNRPIAFESEQRPGVSWIGQWAEAAFPTAARSVNFKSDLRRLSALIALEGGLTPSQTRDLASILVRWRAAGDARSSAAPDAPDERALAGTVNDVVSQWQAIRGDAIAERGLSTALPGLAEVFSFWTMKNRAGVVGSGGVHGLLKMLAAAAPATRVHLVGHSFGGKVMAAAVVGAPEASPNTVESLTILQGAFSHFAFSTKDEIRALGVVTDTDGAYVSILQRKLAAVVAITFSAQDRENQRWYPLGARVARDAFETTAPRYASLGARGIEGPAAVRVDLQKESLAGRYVPTSPRAFNVNASGIVLGHSDIMREPIFRLIADVVAVGRRARN